MLEFGQNTDGSVIKEVSEATFMQDVIEASKEKPVIVDFGRLGVALAKHLVHSSKRQ